MTSTGIGSAGTQGTEPREPRTVTRAGDVLVHPDHWVIDPMSVERLKLQLATADPACSGVVAERADLWPGSSYRVVAERRALSPLSAISSAASSTVDGAVLLRPDVGFELIDAVVEVSSADLLVDPGAVVHDPWRKLGPIEDASGLGRPPFAWRPIVLFMGFDPDPDLADWVRQRANVMVRRRTEARIAVPEPTGGLHLTRPCRPSEASVVALSPDVVVALDEEAVEAAERWLGRNRVATIVQLTQETAAEVDLVSWRVGQAQGRLRARIGRGVDGRALVDLARRLCAGPQPIPPDDAPAPGLRIRAGRGRKAPEARSVSVVALMAPGVEADRTRFDGLADHGRPLGVEVVRGDVEQLEAARSADVVMLRSVSSVDAVHELVAARTRDGRITFVDLGAGDLDSTRAGGRPSLTGDARRLVAAAGLVTVAGPRVRSVARAEGVRTLLLPTLPTTARFEKLRTLVGIPSNGDPTLGWHLGAADGPPSKTDRAMASCVSDLLAGHPDLTVEVVGNAARISALIEATPRLVVVGGSMNPHDVARWTAQIWTPASLRTEIDGDLRPVVEASILGVPTLVPSGDLAATEGLVGPSLTFPSPRAGTDHAELRATIETLLNDPFERSRYGRQSQRLVEGLFGPAAARSAVNRLLGWLRIEGQS